MDLYWLWLFYTSIVASAYGQALTCTTDYFGGNGGGVKSDFNLGRIDGVEWEHVTNYPSIVMPVISSSSTGGSISQRYGAFSGIPCNAIDVSGDGGYFNKVILYYGTCSVPCPDNGNYVR